MFRILAVLCLFLAAQAHAAGMWGVDAETATTGFVPTVGQLKTVMPMGGELVRSTLGWHKVETVRGQLAIPPQFVQLFTNVAAAGDQNVVTLAFGNVLYTNGPDGKPSNMALPVTDEARGAYAAYAAWVAKTVPNLYAVTIWNECNGSFCTGTVAERQTNYRLLMDAAVPAIRAANSNVKIIAGATVGWNTQGWWLGIQKAGFDWARVDMLDFHPYFGAEKENPLVSWKKQLAAIRAGGIRNPAFYSEWGGPSAVKTGPSYVAWFAKNVPAADPVKVDGATWFTLFGKSGLLTDSGALTPLGDAFVKAEITR